MHTETLIIQLQYTLQVAKMNCSGITEEQALVGAESGGNCLNWVMGHVVASRSKLLPMLGKRPLWNRKNANVYQRGSAPLTGPGLTLERIMADFEASQQPIIDGLRNLTPDQLAAKAPFSPWNNPDETVGSLLAGLLFHEAYHVGQTGVLRRVIGLEGAIR